MREFRVSLNVPPRMVRIAESAQQAEPLPRQEPALVQEPKADLNIAERKLAAEREFLEAALSRISESIAELRTAQNSRTSELWQLMVEVGIAAAGRLLYREIEEDRFAIEEMVRDIARQLGDDRPVEIQLNPKDFHLMQRKLGRRLLFPDEETAPKVVPSPAVERGACVVSGSQDSLAHDPVEELSKIRDEMFERIANART